MKTLDELQPAITEEDRRQAATIIEHLETKIASGVFPYSMSRESFPASHRAWELAADEAVRAFYGVSLTDKALSLSKREGNALANHTNALRAAQQQSRPAK